MLNEDQAAIKENEELDGVETDDPVLELDKLKLMKILNNLRITFIVNIHKIIVRH